MIQIVLLFASFGLANGYAKGAPVGACTSMVPGHYGTTAMLTPAQYYLEVAGNTYKPGQNVTLTLRGSGDLKFKGFIISARSADCSDLDTPIGRFFLPPGNITQTFTCLPNEAKYRDNTVTHTSNIEKSSVTFNWYNRNGGHVYFRYTVVKDAATYWTNIATPTLFDTWVGMEGQCAGSQSFRYVSTTMMPYTTTYVMATHPHVFPNRAGSLRQDIAVLALMSSVLLLL